MSSPMQPAEVPASEPSRQTTDWSGRADGAVSAESATERIASRLELLNVLDDAPLAEHADAFGELHDELRSALAEIDGA